MNLHSLVVRILLANIFLPLCMGHFRMVLKYFYVRDERSNILKSNLFSPKYKMFLLAKVRQVESILTT